MKRIVIGALLASLVVSQAVGPVEAKSKSKKKPVVQVDQDKNGIPDAWQKQFHLGYGKQVATKDHDRDGLTNAQEYQLRLNPTKSDSDRDGIKDGKEDVDRDLLTNLQEYNARLNPLKKDSDQDGVQNNLELKRITIKVTDTNKKKFEWRYSIEHQRKELRFKDEIGITNVATLKDRLLVTPSMTEEEVLALVAQTLQLPNIKTLHVQVKFYNGQELESEDEHSDDDGSSDDSGDDEGDDDSDDHGDDHGDDD